MNNMRKIKLSMIKIKHYGIKKVYKKMKFINKP